MKAQVQIAAGAVSLVALLAYTLVHTGGLLSAYVQPGFVGYVAAFGIELAIVSLSLRIGDLRKANQNVGFFLFVLVSVVIVSALANVAEGFQVAQGERLTLATVQKLDAIEAIIGLAATGLISLIVLALSEIVGSDVQTAVTLAERERKTSERSGRATVQHATQPASNLDSLEAANTARLKAKAEALDALLVYLDAKPDASLAEAGVVIGRSKSTVGNYVEELVAAGRLKKNGAGWEVVNLDAAPPTLLDAESNLDHTSN